MARGCGGGRTIFGRVETAAGCTSAAGARRAARRMIITAVCWLFPRTQHRVQPRRQSNSVGVTLKKDRSAELANFCRSSRYHTPARVFQQRSLMRQRDPLPRDTTMRRQLKHGAPRDTRANAKLPSRTEKKLVATAIMPKARAQCSRMKRCPPCVLIRRVVRPPPLLVVAGPAMAAEPARTTAREAGGGGPLVPGGLWCG